MAMALFVVLQLAVSLLAAAAAFARAARAASKAGRIAWIALGTVPFFLSNALVAWSGIALRFEHGLGNAPWGAGVVLFVAYVLGVVWIGARSRAAAWSALPLLFAFVASVAVEASVLWNLQLQGRLRASALALEAGRIAYRESPGAVLAHENAAPVYEQVSSVLEPEEGPSVSDWFGPSPSEDLVDTSDPALLAAVASWGPALESARAATRLPHCQFASPGAEEIVPPPRVVPILHVARGFALEARVRASKGDVRGGLEDVRAIFAIAHQLLDAPVFLAVAMASAMRDLAVDTLARVLASERVTAEDLAAFEFDAPPLSGGYVERGLRLEQAFGLGMVGLFAHEGGAAPSDLGMFTEPVSVLYTALMLEDDVRGYRELMDEFEKLASLPVAELARQLERNPQERRTAVRARGLLATLLVPNVEDKLMTFHRADAHVRLARIAVQAARARATSGSWPKSAAELGVTDGVIVVEGDGTFLLLRDTTPGFTPAPELRVPPMGTR
ncbi:MAG: hypothetical protein IPJ77_23245 [Planctomycetes bacterium]|nr:hypothetical protein [Planctomycetota bacterium]